MKKTIFSTLVIFVLFSALASAAILTEGEYRSMMQKNLTLLFFDTCNEDNSTINGDGTNSGDVTSGVTDDIKAEYGCHYDDTGGTYTDFPDTSGRFESWNALTVIVMINGSNNPGTLDAIVSNFDGNSNNAFLINMDADNDNIENFIDLPINIVHSEYAPELFEGSHYNMITFRMNTSGGTTYSSIVINTTLKGESSGNGTLVGEPLSVRVGQRLDGGSSAQFGIDELYIFNGTLSDTEVEQVYEIWNEGRHVTMYNPPLDTTPPYISHYDMTSEGGCNNWNADKSNACTTLDTTPTVAIITNEIAYCRIGISDLNYTGMGIERNCTGGGTNNHTCTVLSSDVLNQETSVDLYIGCADVQGNENATSNSGGLRIQILSHETRERDAIESGIESALQSDFSVYTDQRVYVRNSADQQATGIFDKVVKWQNKIWAFNTMNANDEFAELYNISPTFFTLELNESETSSINSTVYQMILETK